MLKSCGAFPKFNWLLLIMGRDPRDQQKISVTEEDINGVGECTGGRGVL